MNLIMASLLLLAMLAFQPTLIYGTKSLASAANRNHKSLRNVKRHARADARAALQHGFLADADAPAALSSAAKLVLSMESGDVLVRSARGAAAGNGNATNLDNRNTQNPLGGNAAANGGGGKRQKNNKKLNKNLATQESSLSLASSTAGHKHSNKKSNAAAAAAGAVDNSGAPINANYQLKKRNRERQVLKSQERHQGKKANKEAVAQNEHEKQCEYN